MSYEEVQALIGAAHNPHFQQMYTYEEMKSIREQLKAHRSTYKREVDSILRQESRLRRTIERCRCPENSCINCQANLAQAHQYSQSAGMCQEFTDQIDQAYQLARDRTRRRNNTDNQRRQRERDRALYQAMREREAAEQAAAEQAAAEQAAAAQIDYGPIDDFGSGSTGSLGRLLDDMVSSRRPRSASNAARRSSRSGSRGSGSGSSAGRVIDGMMNVFRTRSSRR